MIIVLSPAKALDYEQQAPDWVIEQATKPFFWQEHSAELLGILQKMSEEQLGNLMKISPNLANLNYERYQHFSDNFEGNNSKPAIFAFNGDVYDSLDVNSLEQKQLQFANQHIRILSGLYGLLRPFDLMQPYRLEMGTRLNNPRGKDLYSFWDDILLKHIINELADKTLHQDSDVIINLASNEYAKALQLNTGKVKYIDIIFKERRGDELKIIGINAKRARGQMARWIVQNEINSYQDLQGFCDNGYVYYAKLSADDSMVFVKG